MVGRAWGAFVCVWVRSDVSDIVADWDGVAAIANGCHLGQHCFAGSLGSALGGGVARMRVAFVVY